MRIKNWWLRPALLSILALSVAFGEASLLAQISPPAEKALKPRASEAVTSESTPAVSPRKPVLSLPELGKRKRLPSALRKEKPEAVEDLKAIETHVRDLAAKVAPAVVAVAVGRATGSGVVISEDGLVLSAAHVCGEPGNEVTFTFPDGKTARGKTLGTNHGIDSGLMQIAETGPWPHVSMGDLKESRLGDWVLALGHPGGFDANRSMVVRLGRIILLDSFVLRTDCTLIGGDSGGPLIDMHGRVVGIHSRISESTAANFHVPISTYQQTWDRLAKSENWGGDRPPPLATLDARTADHPEGCLVARVFDEGAAAQAGLQEGDIIIRFDGNRVRDNESLLEQLAKVSPGDEVAVEIKRGDEDLTVKVTIGTRRGRR